MKQRWTQRPPGSNWGDFGPDDQRGRMNLLTPARRKEAMKEVITGDVFCLSLPLDRPGGQVLNDHRCAPVFKPVMRGGNKVFNFPHDQVDPRFTDVSSDEAVLIYSQYSTQWDAFAHKGSLFDVDGSGERKRVFYNGWRIVDDDEQGVQGELGARAVSIASMAETCVQGRGVMVDLHRHLGEARTQVGLEMLLKIMEADRVSVSEGDILCLHTGLGQLIVDSPPQGPDRSIRLACAVLDGSDQALLNWITDSGIAAIAADNLAVESSSTLGVRKNIGPLGAVLPLHEHCLFKLGVHLGELWYLTELANWLHANQRSRFLLTAPPLRLPGAVGSPVTPVATV
jgi:kynurenine formamidase